MTHELQRRRHGHAHGMVAVLQCICLPAPCAHPKQCRPLSPPLSPQAGLLNLYPAYPAGTPTSHQTVRPWCVLRACQWLCACVLGPHLSVLVLAAPVHARSDCARGSAVAWLTECIGARTAAQRRLPVWSTHIHATCTSPLALRLALLPADACQPVGMLWQPRRAYMQRPPWPAFDAILTHHLHHQASPLPLYLSAHARGSHTHAGKG